MSHVKTLTPVRRTVARHDFADDRVASASSPHSVPSEKTVSRKPRAARRPSTRATERIRERMPLNARVRPRRRLRREFRQAGYAFLFAAPLVFALFLLRGLPESGATNARVESHATSGPPAVSLIIDARKPEPVVLPGYVLPDDGAEESSHHAGG